MTLQRFWTRGAIYLVLAAFCAFYLMPFYVMVITSLKPYADVNVTRMWELPKGLYFGGISQAWTAVAPNFWNSVIITVPAALISSLMGSLNGYIFAKWRFRGADTLFILFLVGMFLPYQGILIPLVLTLQAIGLYASVVGLIMVHCIFGIPITALLFRSYYTGIPNELLDAAKIDGCGFFGIYRWILLPISMPAFAVVLLWQFTSIWNGLPDWVGRLEHTASRADQCRRRQHCRQLGGRMECTNGRRPDRRHAHDLGLSALGQVVYAWFVGRGVEGIRES